MAKRSGEDLASQHRNSSVRLCTARSSLEQSGVQHGGVDNNVRQELFIPDMVEQGGGCGDQLDLEGGGPELFIPDSENQVGDHLDLEGSGPELFVLDSEDQVHGGGDHLDLEDSGPELFVPDSEDQVGGGGDEGGGPDQGGGGGGANLNSASSSSSDSHGGACSLLHLQPPPSPVAIATSQEHQLESKG